jgi:hypothetical protein
MFYFPHGFLLLGWYAFSAYSSTIRSVLKYAPNTRVCFIFSTQALLSLSHRGQDLVLEHVVEQRHVRVIVKPAYNRVLHFVKPAYYRVLWVFDGYHDPKN